MELFDSDERRNAWGTFHRLMSETPGLGPNAYQAFSDIFALEGGIRTDGVTSSGITLHVLSDLIPDAEEDGDIPPRFLPDSFHPRHGVTPDGLSIQDRIIVYGAYFNMALYNVKDPTPGATTNNGVAPSLGLHALELIPDANAAAYLADTLLRHGVGDGAEIVQTSINAAIASLLANGEQGLPDPIAADRLFGNASLEAYIHLVKNEEWRAILFDEMQTARENERREDSDSNGDIESWRPQYYLDRNV